VLPAGEDVSPPTPVLNAGKRAGKPADLNWQDRCFITIEEILMRSVFAAASFVAALAFAMPNVVNAQEPKRSPAAAAAAKAPADQTPPRDAAVPRDSAVPRKAAPSSSRSEGTRGEAVRMAPPAAANATDDDQSRRGAVRRPSSDGERRGGQAPRDRAVTRSGPPPRDWDGDRDRGRDRIYYYPSYYSYGRYYDPYYYGGLHLGYLAYSPWGWTPAFYGYPYGYGAGYGYRQGYDLGSLRLKVKPRDAEVYVDGYYAGNVDDFDGIFQSLKLEIGGYKVEIRKPGFETLTFDVHVQPDRTITYRGEMNAIP
jgi:hypothetical protein